MQQQKASLHLVFWNSFNCLAQAIVAVTEYLGVFVEAYYENLTVDKEMLWLDIPKRKTAFENRAAAYDWIGENPEPILRWLGKHM